MVHFKQNNRPNAEITYGGFSPCIMQEVRLAPPNGLLWPQNRQNSDILANKGFSSLLFIFFSNEMKQDATLTS